MLVAWLSSRAVAGMNGTMGSDCALAELRLRLVASKVIYAKCFILKKSPE
jgi:hypothetical protein